jgi:hypothetical protein
MLMIFYYPAFPCTSGTILGSGVFNEDGGGNNSRQNDEERLHSPMRPS